MMTMEPPEPRCPRCGEYMDENDQKYCPGCFEELDFENIKDAYTLICPNCNRLVEEHEIQWRCHKCGFDGREQKCAACGKILKPKEDDICEKCQKEEWRQQSEDPDFWTDMDEYFSDMAKQEENNGWEGQ